MYIFIFWGGGKAVAIELNIYIYMYITYNSGGNVKTNLCFLDHGGEIYAPVMCGSVFRHPKAPRQPCARTTRLEQRN